MMTVISKTVLHCPECKSPLEQVNDDYFCRNCTRSFPVIDGIPSFINHRTTYESFNSKAFESLFIMEQRHFWHVGRKEIILNVLRRNVPDLEKIKMLEIGCGNGNVLGYLKQNGVCIEGGDIFQEGLYFCHKRVNTTVLYQLDILSLPFDKTYDVIGAFDVLEHINDDVKALMEISKALKAGGGLLLTVPAHRFLWSHFDERSRHQRRYNKFELVNKLEQAGFTVKKVSYYMFFLFPLLASVRLFNNIFSKKRLKTEGVNRSLESQTIPVINDIFLALLRLEKYLMNYLSLPIGASLIVLGIKNE